MTILSQKSATFQEMKEKFPEVIYKYREWENSKHKRVITHQELFCSPPSLFIDPKDCKGALRYDLLTEKEKIKCIEFRLREDDELNRPNEPKKTRNYYRTKSREIFKTSAIRDNNRIKEFNKETEKEDDEQLGVLSLTANPKIKKMWVDYADNHKGFCIGYHSVELFTCDGGLGSGGDVTYVKELPTIYPTPKHTLIQQLLYQIYYKEDKWIYEEEYRTYKYSAKSLNSEERIIKVPPKAFKELILGAKLNTEEKKEIVNSIPNILSHIKILETEIINDCIVIKNYL